MWSWRRMWASSWERINLSWSGVRAVKVETGTRTTGAIQPTSIGVSTRVLCRKRTAFLIPSSRFSERKRSSHSGVGRETEVVLSRRVHIHCLAKRMDMKSTPKLQHQAAMADTSSVVLEARGMKRVGCSSHADVDVVAAAVGSSQRNVPTKQRKETNIAPEATR